MLWHQLVICAIFGLALSQLHTVSSQASANSNCTNNFTQVGEKCLLPVSAFKNWYEAERVCRLQGAGVLALKSEAELNLVSKWLNDTMKYTLDLWTCGTTLGGNNGYYFWQSTGETAYYLPWGNNQPNKKAGDCLMLSGVYINNSVTNYRLQQRNCTEWASTVCEKPLSKSTNSTSRICLKPGSYETVQVVLN